MKDRSEFGETITRYSLVKVIIPWSDCESALGGLLNMTTLTSISMLHNALSRCLFFF